MFVSRLRGIAARARRRAADGSTKRNGAMRSVALVCVTALVTSAASATAASLITGKQIKDGTITAKDLKKGSIALNRLSPGVQTQIKKGLSSPSPTVGGATSPGNQGESGQVGAQGPAGAAGTNGTNGT